MLCIDTRMGQVQEFARDGNHIAKASGSVHPKQKTQQTPPDLDYQGQVAFAVCVAGLLGSVARWPVLHQMLANAVRQA